MKHNIKNYKFVSIIITIFDISSTKNVAVHLKKFPANAAVVHLGKFPPNTAVT